MMQVMATVFRVFNRDGFNFCIIALLYSYNTTLCNNQGTEEVITSPF